MSFSLTPKQLYDILKYFQMYESASVINIKNYRCVCVSKYRILVFGICSLKLSPFCLLRSIFLCFPASYRQMLYMGLILKACDTDCINAQFLLF